VDELKALAQQEREIVAQMLYGDGNGNVPDERKPTTMQQKIHAASKATLLRAAKVAVMSTMLMQHRDRQKLTIEVPELKRWDNTEPHSAEPLLKGRRGKGTRKQRKAKR
jgi:hypothetical protein